MARCRFCGKNSPLTAANPEVPSSWFSDSTTSALPTPRQLLQVTRPDLFPSVFPQTFFCPAQTIFHFPVLCSK